MTPCDQLWQWRDTNIADPRGCLTTTYIGKYLAEFDPNCSGWKVFLVAILTDELCCVAARFPVTNILSVGQSEASVAWLLTNQRPGLAHIYSWYPRYQEHVTTWGLTPPTWSPANCYPRPGRFLRFPPGLMNQDKWSTSPPAGSLLHQLRITFNNWSLGSFHKDGCQIMSKCV